MFAAVRNPESRLSPAIGPALEPTPRVPRTITGRQHPHLDAAYHGPTPRSDPTPPDTSLRYIIAPHVAIGHDDRRNHPGAVCRAHQSLSTPLRSAVRTVLAANCTHPYGRDWRRLPALGSVYVHSLAHGISIPHGLRAGLNLPAFTLQSIVCKSTRPLASQTGRRPTDRGGRRCRRFGIFPSLGRSDAEVGRTVSTVSSEPLDDPVGPR